MAGTAEIAAAKSSLRQTIRKRRAGLSTEALRQSAADLRSTGAPVHEQLSPGSIIAAYLPFGSEPPVLPLLSELASDHSVFVPVCLPGRVMNWVLWEPGAELLPGPLPGLMEPSGERHSSRMMADAAVIFIPALAVSRDGSRLGQGGGYYDRFLAELSRGPLRCAVVFDEEVLPAGAIPTDSRDQAVEHVLCPGFTASLGSAGTPGDID
ncbi:5-formyltetrahydrofolate cyclo-ligase [Acaricomes phytoseiuli]|uniref:5-formyltetrahydrofolate cyclo-ligase n=1 Tax=Acaricomes phytoseiuli TaxID=291968 RepID=UPI002221B949|nr:5-formyltetrahydrofolate cyclo-ligase [Acaricomes phytoseiuli]MCW1250093.1 5-formyltetrahydrofolate cyclo-ligase [Acaricomes phytoseiuli]